MQNDEDDEKRPQKAASGGIGSPGLLLVTSRSNSRDNDDYQRGEGGKREKENKEERNTFRGTGI